MSTTGAVVECYSGHTYAQEPRHLVWQGRRYAVARVELRWRTPEGPAFWVRTDSSDRFELRYCELEDRWAIRPLSNNDALDRQRSREWGEKELGQQIRAQHASKIQQMQDKEVQR